MEKKGFKLEEKTKHKIFNTIVFICLLGAIFENGMLLEYKICKDNMFETKRLYENLKEEYAEYKEHSYVLHG